MKGMIGVLRLHVLNLLIPLPVLQCYKCSGDAKSCDESTNVGTPEECFVTNTQQPGTCFITRING